MSLESELLTKNKDGENITVQEGLLELGDDATPVKAVMETRTYNPILKDGTDTWDTWQDSKSMNRSGSKNKDCGNKYVFKIDSEVSDLMDIVSREVGTDGSITDSRDSYDRIRATQFVVLDETHAIRVDKYQDVEEKLEQKEYSLDDLKDGIFKINCMLTQDEIIQYKKSEDFDSKTLEEKFQFIDELTLDDFDYVHDGWSEHAVGKSEASQEEYLEATKLLAKYVIKAEDENCFRSTGMGFYISTNEDDFNVRPWYVYSSNGRSGA